MLGIAMLASFLVGYLSRALLALSRCMRPTCPRLLLAAAANLDAHRYRRRPWLVAVAGEVPVLAQPSGPPGLLIQRLGGILDSLACDPAMIIFRSALPAFFPNMGRSDLLIERLGGVLDRLGCNPALVIIRSTLRAFAPEVGRPGRPAGVAGGLLRAEERIQQARVVRLGGDQLVL
jgi:hypothetical protein